MHIVLCCRLQDLKLASGVLNRPLPLEHPEFVQGQGWDETRALLYSKVS